MKKWENALLNKNLKSFYKFNVLLSSVSSGGGSSKCNRMTANDSVA